MLGGELDSSLDITNGARIDASGRYTSLFTLIPQRRVNIASIDATIPMDICLEIRSLHRPRLPSSPISITRIGGRV